MDDLPLAQLQLPAAQPGDPAVDPEIAALMARLTAIAQGTAVLDPEASASAEDEDRINSASVEECLDILGRIAVS